MSRVATILFTTLALAGLASVWIFRRPSPPRASGPLPSACYIWQRHWNHEVQEATRTAPGLLSGLAPLCAEMRWDAAGKLSVAWPNVDADALRASGRPISAVLRVGPRLPTAAAQGEVCRIAAEVLTKLRSARLDPIELQIDFDAAASQLDGYRAWLTALRTTVAPLPVRPTVLPSWLSQPTFAELATECGGYVLQVHATTQPRLDAPETALCEATDARRWVEQAGRLGIPFRVALPTYTYRVAFQPDGRFLGIEAEGTPRVWPAGTVLRAFRPNAEHLANLIHDWKHDRPACLLGLLWYRLPVAGDTQNWRWPTLSAVLQGRAPRIGLQVEKSSGAPSDLVLVNFGEADAPFPARITATSSGPIEATDGAGGYQAQTSGQSVAFVRSPTLDIVRLPPGARHPIGWLRASAGIQIQQPSP